MTITYVGAGTSATGNNASVTPVKNASTADGDLVLVFASIRNSGTGVPNAPAGWSSLAASGNMAVFGRFFTTGYVLPAFTFTGGVANADTIAQTITLRGVEPRLNDAVGAISGQLNGSAQNIAYPGFDVPGAAHVVILQAWKQDDWTSASTPSGFNAGPTTSTTTGDDAAQAVFYAIETVEFDIPATSVTVTGGASAISRIIWVALRPAATLVVTEQDVYPPRVTIAVSGLTLGDQLEIFREVGGNRTAIRGGYVFSVTDTGFVVVDAELPFGAPVRYVAVVNGAVEYVDGPTTYTLPGGKVVLSDAIGGGSAEVAILAAAARTTTRDSARFRAGGRNLVVSAPFGQGEGSYDLFTETTVARDGLIALLTEATEGVTQIRQPLTGVYDGVDAYLAVDRFTETRWSQDGSDPRRVITIEFAEVTGWAADLTARGFTYAEVEAYYSGITYASAAGDYVTYLDALQGDFS